MVIYFDNNATTRPDPQVIEAMLPFYTEMWGNPSSLYSFGHQIVSHIEKARAQVAQLIGARRPSEILFTSSGSESNFTAVHSALHLNPHKKRIVISAVEHSSVYGVCHELQQKGYELILIPVKKSGALNLEAFKASLTAQVALVSIMWANNETGVLFPIETIAPLCEQHHIPLHVDGVQTAGKIPLDVSSLPLTSLSLSAHKIHGPKGVGALYVRRGTKFTPLFSGGTQEMGRRAGTENVASIIGFSKAAELALSHLSQMDRVRRLRDHFESQIKKDISDVLINGGEEKRVPNTSSMTFSGREAEALVLMLSEHGICVSTGSACSTGSLEPSRVLVALGHSPSQASGTLRISFSRESTEKEAEYLKEKLVETLQKMKKKAFQRA
ncbi:MAG: hypothetical protein A3I05_07570 [Deltaproteobacteria bacterium RIFCSPLOWO2_02_FULL_44_10]|nr:MAG: hypothetical protein A3C46_04430 [Deltaproteobacteria bacterium RIFCSPHIGHO2_02_FULL_44_16]OGQ47049.1 MAG: hypothetical protein A3I05_07570 [Deltaproteobacteria bacterium RIFCSPLOWO2_02_FULL_44_10]